MRIGLLGGSFNPIHRGHIAMALAARDQLGLDEVVLVPSARPPHKRADPSMAPAEDRLAMARLAVAVHRGLSVSDIEQKREGLSYTIDTVKAFLPRGEVVFIVGADSVPELKTWRNAAELLRIASFAVVTRPGYDLEKDLAQLAKDFGAEVAQGLRGRTIVLDHAISATMIRERLRKGEPVDAFVPSEVREYIAAHKLYQEGIRK